MKKDIIAMAQEVGFVTYGEDAGEYRIPTPAFHCRLERFAALVADAEAKRMHAEGMVTVGHMREQIAAEREACAKVCDRMAKRTQGIRSAVLEMAAENIRARGQS